MLEDLFRIPYYKAVITRNGIAYKMVKVRVSSEKSQFFRVAKIKKAFILPDISDVPPVQIKSGFLVVYDDRNVFPLDLLSSEVVTKIKSDESTMLARLIGIKKADEAISPSYWIKTAMDPAKLDEWFEARCIDDILSPPPATDFPMWAIYFIAVVAVVALVMGTIYMISNGNLSLPGAQAGVQALPTMQGGYVVAP